MVQITFGPADDPFDTDVISPNEVAAARRVMSLISEASDLEVEWVKATVGEGGPDHPVVRVKAAIKDGEHGWRDPTSLDGGVLGQPSYAHSAVHGCTANYHLEQFGVAVDVTLFHLV